MTIYKTQTKYTNQKITKLVRSHTPHTHMCTVYTED